MDPQPPQIDLGGPQTSLSVPLQALVQFWWCQDIAQPKQCYIHGFSLVRRVALSVETDSPKLGISHPKWEEKMYFLAEFPSQHGWPSQ